MRAHERRRLDYGAPLHRHSGIEVHWINEPDNSSVSFGSDGAIGGEYDPRFTFAVVGNVIEWRPPHG